MRKGVDVNVNEGVYEAYKNNAVDSPIFGGF